MTTNEAPRPEPSNPYAPPEPASAKVVETGEPTAEELRAFFGSNSDYFLGRWWRFRQSRHDEWGFNWAAFFLAGLWMGYRKMVRVTILFYAVVIVETIAEELLFVLVWGYDEAPNGVARLTGLAFAVVAGMFGNRWYLRHAENEIAQAKAEGLEGDSLLHALASRGGTSVALSIGLFVAYLAVTFAVFLGLEIWLWS